MTETKKKGTTVLFDEKSFEYQISFNMYVVIVSSGNEQDRQLMNHDANCKIKT